MSLNREIPARDLGYQVPQVLRKRVTFETEGEAVVVGTIPAGASVIGGGIHVVTAFDDTATVDVGFAGGSSTDDPDAYGSALAATAIGFIALDGLAGTTNIQQTVDTQVTATVNDGTGAVSAGEADVIIQYVA
ncbi:hypothetical protein NO932_06600 [Pelagibacterium sp. 26DY04]|uniref:hypothetical protein n=1 Tax=Pelagibacterium sp. 26DY04 TaxID=2967130 RepID=UPI0028150809|nr:hypothetical protein [Pelagibacterium sp. 26DY04]WMT88275.1 hypothetical protein NO932_06600 [Pelagibacterium sp. 26DY04]